MFGAGAALLVADVGHRQDGERLSVDMQRARPDAQIQCLPAVASGDAALLHVRLAAQARRLQDGKSVIDAVRDQAKRLNRALGADDREKIENGLPA